MIRLYTDLVALTEDEKVKQETVALAEKLLSDVRAQVEEGTLAQVEMTRANAQVFSTRQDLINARGLREEQEAIFKNVITRRGNEDPEVAGARIIPTDTLTIPATDEIRPMQDLVADALAHRPDLGQARLQIANSQIGLQGARSLTRPQLDLVGVMQNNGLAGQANPFVPNPDPGFLGGYGSVLGQIFARNYPTYGVGLQMTLPIRNRVAEADLARDEMQVKQSEIRLRQLQNQARLEVEDALIAMRRARASYEAAAQARTLAGGIARRRAGQVRSRRLHQLLRHPIREPAGAGPLHRSRRPQFLREGEGRAAAGDGHDPGREPHQRGSRDQRQIRR